MGLREDPRALADAGAHPPWPWADTWPVARLRAPAHGIDLVVLAGATGRTLAFGPGHLSGSAAPGGFGTSVLAGHRDTHFAFLRGTKPGDELRLETADGTSHRYRIRWQGVVHERNTSVTAEREADALVLVTCWPFDAVRPGGPWRFVVIAERDGSPRERKAVPPPAVSREGRSVRT